MSPNSGLPPDVFWNVELKAVSSALLRHRWTQSVETFSGVALAKPEVQVKRPPWRSPTPQRPSRTIGPGESLFLDNELTDLDQRKHI